MKKPCSAKIIRSGVWNDVRLIDELVTKMHYKQFMKNLFIDSELILCGVRCRAWMRRDLTDHEAVSNTFVTIVDTIMGYDFTSTILVSFKYEI